ncbi:DUF5123 domain-containing protein [Flavobacteriaceae bacterium SZ-1-7]|uniref:DUF5123 domain-containing protein n=1 Tax=Tamlana sedimenti TaxID=3134126 RepID=UPI003121ED17
MKTQYIVKTLSTFILTLLIVSCGYHEDVVEELSISREFAPVDLTARVRNQTFVELSWAVNESVDYYVVEFSADDPNFTNIFQSEIVTASELPILIRLEGETVYSIRVKAVSDRGLNDSSWALGEATTLSEQIMQPSQIGDIQATQATLRWEAGLNVTHFILQPGDIRYDISASEKASGVATITGLTGDTEYSAILYNNSKVRGFADFLTEVDPSTGTVINSSNDILQMIENAAPGDVILLEPGDYTSQTGTATLDKPITVRSLLSYDKAKLGINFEINGGATDVSLINLDLDGALTVSDVVRFTGAGNYNSLLLSGCNIHDFARSFIAGNVTDAIVQNVTVENCIVTNILTAGGDFIDFRNSDALGVTITSSTFNNCAPGRDFLRLDAAGTSNGNSICNILIDSCTIYACSNSDSRRILYVRFQTNEVTVQNTLIAETESEGYADRTGVDESPTFNNNNYFNAPGFINPDQFIFDASNYTELDPGFVDPLAGDFTVTNQTLLDNQVGDPRWRP